MAEKQTWFTRCAVASITAFVLLIAWGLVGLSVYMIIRVGVGQGLTQPTATLLALPALLVPIWKSVQVLRNPSLERALLGHIWILNGGVVWAVISMGGLWWITSLRAAMEGSRQGLLIVLLVGGFPPLFGLLVALNWWLLRRRGG
jgi:hypothetical protein